MIEKNEELKWLKENAVLVNVSQKLEKNIIERLYKLYNMITGENKKMSGCGKCLFNVTKRLKVELTKLEGKELRYIYRTNFKQLSLKETKDIAFSFWVKDDNELKIRLEHLKNLQKLNR